MRIPAGSLRDLIRRIVVTEATEPFSFRPGEEAVLIRPVRVTPIAHGDWADMDTRGVMGYEGGEDSPGARRQTRPRGITAAILRPGTRCKILRAGKNEAVCTPIDPETGEAVVDEKTGAPLTNVRIHVNKFSPEHAEQYISGKAARPAVPIAQKPLSREERLAQLRAEIERLEAGSKPPETTIPSDKPPVIRRKKKTPGT